MCGRGEITSVSKHGAHRLFVPTIAAKDAAALWPWGLIASRLAVMESVIKPTAIDEKSFVRRGFGAGRDKAVVEASGKKALSLDRHKPRFVADAGALGQLSDALQARCGNVVAHQADPERPKARRPFRKQ